MIIPVSCVAKQTFLLRLSICKLDLMLILKDIKNRVVKKSWKIWKPIVVAAF